MIGDDNIPPSFKKKIVLKNSFFCKIIKLSFENKTGEFRGEFDSVEKILKLSLFFVV